MGAAGAWAIGVVALVLLAVTGPGAATAAPIRAESDLEAGFELRGTHGYSISVAAGAEDATTGRGTMTILVRGHGASVSYRAGATVTPQGVRADLGKLGKVDVTRIPSGRERSVHLKCGGPRLIYEPATYEGTIEFNGEKAYTRASAHRVAQLPTLLMMFSADACRGSGFGETISSEEHGARIRGLSFAHGRTLAFQLFKNSTRSRTLASAELRERRGGISIKRELSQRLLPASAFRFDQTLTTAHLRPPAPFSGAATVTRAPNSVSRALTGSLTLSFPGRSVSLTGPSMHVTVVHARYTRSDSGEVEIGF